MVAIGLGIPADTFREAGRYGFVLHIYSMAVLY